MQMLLGRSCPWSKRLLQSQTHEERLWHQSRKLQIRMIAARLYLNKKKTKLFCTEVDFLGHHISECGIEADCCKTEKILAWPVPKSATQARSFLGLVRYVAAFLLHLADHTGVLQDLSTKDVDK